MSSGRRVLVVNTQERAVSTDINRLQAFAARDEAEAMRQLLDVTTDDFDPGFVSEPTSVTANAGAEILGGLMVRPTLGSLNLIVDPGVAYLVASDGGFDDSIYKYVRDVGVQALGALVMTANASGQIRIDVVECQINPTPSLATDNRDIFDPTTGLFTASVVTKEAAAQLTYRVRQGTPGAGFPGVVAGWLALAVAHVPNGAASNDVITFWDVRALVADRTQASAVGNLSAPQLLQLDAKHDRVSAVSTLVSGTFRANLNGRRLGGQFRRGSPGVDAASIDIASIDNQGALIAEPLSAHVYVYACTPFGLPRWARYADAPSARLPRTTKGLLVATQVVPDLFGKPSATFPIPASYGFVGATVSDAVCVAIAPFDGSAFFSRGFATNKRYIPSNLCGSVAPSALAGGVYNFVVTDALWPPNARAIHVRLVGLVTLPAATIEYQEHAIHVFGGPAATGPYSEVRYGEHLVNSTGGALGLTISQFGWIPLPVQYPGATSSPRLVQWDVGVTTGTPSAFGAGFTFLQVYGFEL